MAQLADSARTAYMDAIAALGQWSKANEQRMDMAEKVIAEGIDDATRQAASEAYRSLCETEMLMGGAAILAISKAHELLMQAYDELAPEPLLSAPGDTTTG